MNYPQVTIGLLFLISTTSAIAQPVMEVEGSIKIGNNNEPNPSLGTMRWSGSDFEIWNGVIWASLTGNKEVGTVEDIDKNIYKTIRIGSQVWMAENLRVSHYRNGEMIHNIPSDTDWSNLTIGAYCWYDNDSNYEVPYGKLYNGYAIVNNRGICPTGWHVSANEEWKELISYLGGSAVAAGKLREEGVHWNINFGGATNESGFTALPGGIRRSNGDFAYIGGSGWFSDGSGTGTYIISNDIEGEGLTFPTGGLSVRCIKDN